MGWGWKAAGAYFGSLGGPLGAVIGLGIGHIIDKSYDAPQGQTATATATATAAPPAGKEQREAQTRSRLYIATLANYLFHLSKADGETSAEEWAFLRDRCLELDAANPTGIPAGRFQEFLVDACREPHLQDRLYEFLRTDEEMRNIFLQYAWRMAAQDGSVSDAELDWVCFAAQRMGATKKEVYVASIHFFRPAQDDSARRTHLETLGLPLDADAAQIKAAFKEQSYKYHPDRHANAAPELKSLAQEKFIVYQKAYRALKAAPREPEWYGRCPDTAYPVLAVAAGRVACFQCSAKWRLPEARHFRQLRCQRCKSLLLHEGDFAEIFCKPWREHA